MTYFLFNLLHAHIKVLIVCFTSVHSHSWPHWPQDSGVNFLVTFTCCHFGNPHTPHYLMSTCLLSLLTTLTTKKWYIFSFDLLQAHIKILIACFTSAQSNSWPHWPQGGALNFFVTFLCYHPVNPHWPHYLSSTCSLSFLTTLTTKWWYFIWFNP